MVRVEVFARVATKYYAKINPSYVELDFSAVTPRKPFFGLGTT